MTGKQEKAPQMPIHEAIAAAEVQPDLAIARSNVHGDVANLFERRKTIEVDGQKLDIVDMHPDKQKTAIPTIVVPGFIATADTMSGVMRGLRHAGRRTLSLNNTHGIDTQPVARLPHAQVRKAVAFLRMLEAEGIEKTDAVGQSEGAITLAIAATLRPDKFRNVVLVNPAGLYGDDNVFTLGARFLLGGVQELLYTKTTKASVGQKEEWDMMGREAGRAISEGKVHSIKEVLDISAIQTPKLLRKMKEKHGIGVSIIATKNDVVFPLHRNVKRVSRETGVPPENIRRIKGIHNPHTDVLEELVQEIDGALSRMEQSQAAAKKPQ